MPTVHRFGNLRFVIFVNDHDPPHVHVFGAGAEARIVLGPRPSLDWARGFDRVTLKRALAEVAEKRGKLLAAWRRWHEE